MREIAKKFLERWVIQAIKYLNTLQQPRQYDDQRRGREINEKYRKPKIRIFKMQLENVGNNSVIFSKL